jgi:hypothetical protein
MALEGDLHTIPARELFGWLAQRRASGTLSLSRDMTTWQLQLQGGRVSLASSSDEETLLGRLLIERGLIDKRQLAAVLEQRGRSRARLGKVLTRAGLVSAEDIARVLSDKVARLLADTLTWGDGRFFFDDRAAVKKRPAVETTVDLAVLLERTAAAPPAPGEPEGEVVSDSDILEVTEVDGVAGRARVKGGRRKRTMRIGYYGSIA